SSRSLPVVCSRPCCSFPRQAGQQGTPGAVLSPWGAPPPGSLAAGSRAAGSRAAGSRAPGSPSAERRRWARCSPRVRGGSAGTGALVRVIGYPDGAQQPVWCAGLTKAFSPTQLEFDCGGYTNGTSGGPFLAGVSASSGQGTIIGVIGGYQQGGDTPQVSYSPA